MFKARRSLIWNSGNQEISEEHFLRALQLKTNFKWSDHRLSLYGLDDSQVIGDLTNGLRVKSLFPKSGVKLVFFTREHSGPLIVTGAINGGNNATSGVVHRTLDAGSFVRGPFGYFVIAMWLGLGLVVFRKYKPESLADRIFTAVLPPGLGVVFAWILFLFVWKTTYGPPF
jgi:hypothetical protein